MRDIRTGTRTVQRAPLGAQTTRADISAARSVKPVPSKKQLPTATFGAAVGGAVLADKVRPPKPYRPTVGGTYREVLDLIDRAETLGNLSKRDAAWERREAARLAKLGKLKALDLMLEQGYAPRIPSQRTADATEQSLRNTYATALSALVRAGHLTRARAEEFKRRGASASADELRGALRDIRAKFKDVRLPELAATSAGR